MLVHAGIVARRTGPVLDRCGTRTTGGPTSRRRGNEAQSDRQALTLRADARIGLPRGLHAGCRLGDSEQRVSVQAVVRDSLKHLDKRERYIVEKRLMADREEELSLAEIGRRLGVSRERARQLEARARRKLKGHISQLSEANGVALDLHAA